MANENTTRQCPICGGTGIMTAEYYEDGSERMTTCVACGGDGVLPVVEEMRHTRSEWTTPWHLDIEAAAKIWSNAPFPSKSSMDRAHRALKAFADTLPPDATVEDLKVELEKWKISR